LAIGHRPFFWGPGDPEDLVEFRDALDIFSLAESVFYAMKESRVLTVEPANFWMPISLPQHNADAFAVVSNGGIQEIEIHYSSGKIETLRLIR
jgi:hypothetical protein